LLNGLAPATVKQASPIKREIRLLNGLAPATVKVAILDKRQATGLSKQGAELKAAADREHARLAQQPRYRCGFSSELN
jgi:hypothetical protein